MTNSGGYTEKQRKEYEELCSRMQKPIELKKPEYGVTIVRSARQTGKTYAVIKLMEENPEMITIVPVSGMRGHYPEHLRERVLTVEQFIERPYHEGKFDVLKNKVVVDEGFFLNPSLVKLYYMLGMHGIGVLVVGT